MSAGLAVAITNGQLKPEDPPSGPGGRLFYRRKFPLIGLIVLLLAAGGLVVACIWCAAKYKQWHTRKDHYQELMYNDSLTVSQRRAATRSMANMDGADQRAAAAAQPAAPKPASVQVQLPPDAVASPAPVTAPSASEAAPLPAAARAAEPAPVASSAGQGGADGRYELVEL